MRVKKRWKKECMSDIFLVKLEFTHSLFKKPYITMQWQLTHITFPFSIIIYKREKKILRTLKIIGGWNFLSITSKKKQEPLDYNLIVHRAHGFSARVGPQFVCNNSGHVNLDFNFQCLQLARGSSNFSLYCENPHFEDGLMITNWKFRCQSTFFCKLV